MPLYDYKCDNCGFIVEDVFKRATSEPDITCPECGSKVTTRAQSVFATSFKLKGQGWFKDSYTKDPDAIKVKS